MAEEGGAWETLKTMAGKPTRIFTPAMVADLPEPARRFFEFAIAPGTPLASTVELTMRGELRLGSSRHHRILPMRACQILAGIDGFVWTVGAGGSIFRIIGSDAYLGGRAWSRLWLSGVMPLVRAGGTSDFARSAVGRAIAEAAMWSPAALLPSKQVTWEPSVGDQARAIVTHGVHTHRLDLRIDAEGRLLSVSILRWSRENRERRWQLQPFGGTVAAHRKIQGFTVPTIVEGGNWFGTDQYFPFYKAVVEQARFL